MAERSNSSGSEVARLRHQWFDAVYQLRALLGAADVSGLEQEAAKQAEERTWGALREAEEAAPEQLKEAVEIPLRAPGQEWRLYGIPFKGRRPGPNDSLWGIESVRQVYDPGDGMGPCSYTLVSGLYGEDAEVLLEILNASGLKPEAVIERCDPDDVAKPA